MYNHPVSARRLALPLVVLVAAVLAGCQQREVEKVLKVTDVNTGWYDVGIVAGQNKIVPSVSFHLQNVSPEPIENVQINAVFRRLDEAESWGDRLIRGVGSDGLAAGATGKTLVVRNERGYTGSEPRAQMLKNSLFMDAKVDLFARHGSRTWVKIGEFPIERKLLTQQ
jgi:hypothetical protein